MVELAILKKFEVADHVPPVVYENLPVVIYKKSPHPKFDWKIEFNIEGYRYCSLDVREEDLIRGKALDEVLPIIETLSPKDIVSAA